MDNDLINCKVSIIMPAYNAENYINDAINSVVAQTYGDWELIVVDDGSIDSTSKLVNNWLLKDKRIQYFYQENGKQGKARNLAISKSKGEYLAFLDADDLWMPQKLEIQIKEIQEKNVDLVFSDSYFFYNNEINDTSKKMDIGVGIFYTQDSVKLFLEGNRIPILTVFVKKDIVLGVGGFSESLIIQDVEDYHLWLKLLMSNSVFYSSDHVLAKYRIHSNSVTSNDKLVLNKIPCVFYDLTRLYPIYKNQIIQELKIKFKSFYIQNLFTKVELAFWIKKNALYLSKQQWNCLYLLLNFLLPTKVTKRILIYMLNA